MYNASYAHRLPVLKDLRDKVAVVTGASRGLGANIAQALFAEGMLVAVTARSSEDLRDVQREFDPTRQRSLAAVADITVDRDRVRMLKTVRAKFGRVDVLVNNAGHDYPDHFVDADLARITRMFELNILATIRLTQLVLPEMVVRRSGHIVNISSVAGLLPVPYSAAYAATKHAMVGFSESLRGELRRAGVGVSVICPALVRDSGVFHDHGVGRAPVGTSVSAAEVERAVVSAIRKNSGRVVVAPFAAMFAPIGQAAAPDMLSIALRRSGAVRTMRKMADRNREARREAAPKTR